MTANIYDLANELERNIRQLPEYKAVEELKQEIDTKPESKATLDQYVDFQKEIQQQLQAGQMPDASAQETFTELGQKVQADALLVDYFNKQQQLSIYVADIEKIIFKPLQDLL